MQVHARLRSQRGTPAGEVRARTLRALAVMGLWRVRNTQVRGHCTLIRTFSSLYSKGGHAIVKCIGCLLHQYYCVITS